MRNFLTRRDRGRRIRHWQSGSGTGQSDPCVFGATGADADCGHARRVYGARVGRADFMGYCQMLCMTRDQAASFLTPSTKGTPSMTSAIN